MILDAIYKFIISIPYYLVLLFVPRKVWNKWKLKMYDKVQHEDRGSTSTREKKKKQNLKLMNTTKGKFLLRRGWFQDVKYFFRESN